MLLLILLIDIFGGNIFLCGRHGVQIHDNGSILGSLLHIVMTRLIYLIIFFYYKLIKIKKKHLKII